MLPLGRDLFIKVDVDLKAHVYSNTIVTAASGIWEDKYVLGCNFFFCCSYYFKFLLECYALAGKAHIFSFIPLVPVLYSIGWAIWLPSSLQYCITFADFIQTVYA